MMWTNDSIPFAFNSEIVEWDIQSGNTSIMEYFQLISQKKIDQLKDAPKQTRLIAVGLLQNSVPGLRRKLEEGFDTIVNLFIDNNDLNRDTDILTIMRDAVYVKNRTIRYADYPPSVHFIPKNQYHAYLLLGNIKVFFKRGKCDVKGIADEQVDSHKDGILKFLNEVIDLREHSSQASLNEYFHSVADAYKKRELDLDWYREFNASSSYKLTLDGMEANLPMITEDELPDIDISYNYTKIILPLIQMLG